MLSIAACATDIRFKDASKKDIVITQASVSDGEVAVSDDVLSALKPDEMMRVGLLLPMTGKSEKVGKALQNAALMSLFDAGYSHLVLQFYDTKGTPEGARDAAELAIRQGVELIIGPVFAPELRAMREKATSAGVGIITFSSDPANVGKGVYTISTLTSQQVERIVSHTCGQGYKRLALLAPDNATGDIIALAAKRAIDACGGMITKTAYYDPKTENLLPVVAKIMPKMVEELEREKDEYIAALEKILNDPETKVKKVHLKNPDGSFKNATLTAEQLIAYIEKIKNAPVKRSPFEFDMLLVPEEGSKLRSFGALFAYYDLPSSIRVIGTSQWATSRPARESALIGGWFAGMPSAGFDNFSKRYAGLYGEKPMRIASQAYDAVALAASLAQTGGFSYSRLTDSSGFNGIDGLFRLLDNGLSERGLTVMGVERNGFSTLSPAPKVFVNNPDVADQTYIPEFRYSEELTAAPFDAGVTAPVAR